MTGAIWHGLIVSVRGCSAAGCFTMFSTSSVNVIGFDPTRNIDQARGYAAKYCAKPEKWHRGLPIDNFHVVVARLRHVLLAFCKPRVLHGDDEAKRWRGPERL